MPTVRVDISPNIFDWILKTISLEGMDDKLIRHFYDWKNNKKQPTFNQIEDFSIKTHIPLGYFFLQTPPYEPLPLLNFRTIKSESNTNPSRELIDTYYHMTAIQDWMRDFLVEAGNEKLSFVGSCKDEKQTENIVALIRNTLNLNIEWYTESKSLENSFEILRKHFEDIGILVMKNGVVGQNNYRHLDIFEFRAFTLLDDYAPLVFINNNDYPASKLFSLLHEIAHIWIGLHSFYNDSYGMSFNISPLETICNAVAAELLVPQQVFIDKWEKNKLSIKEKVDKLADYFICSRAVIIRKALDNNFITGEQYQKFEKEIIAILKNNKTINRGGGNYYSTIKSRFSARFIMALGNSFDEGRTLFKEVHRLTGTNRESFSQFISEVRKNHNA